MTRPWARTAGFTSWAAWWWKPEGTLLPSLLCITAFIPTWYMTRKAAPGSTGNPFPDGTQVVTLSSRTHKRKPGKTGGSSSSTSTVQTTTTSKLPTRNPEKAKSFASASKSSETLIFAARARAWKTSPCQTEGSGGSGEGAEASWPAEGSAWCSPITQKPIPGRNISGNRTPEPKKAGFKQPLRKCGSAGWGTKRCARRTEGSMFSADGDMKRKERK